MDSASRECCEEWKVKLKESEETCLALKRNAQTIKDKIINTSWCLNQLKQAQEKLKKANEEITGLRKNNQLLPLQLEQQKQENLCLRQQIEQMLTAHEPTLKELEAVKEELAKKTTVIQAKDAYIFQLEATAKETKEARDSFDKVQKEAARLHKDLSTKESQYKEVNKKLKNKDKHIDALDKQIEKLTANLDAANSTIMTLELELSLKEKNGTEEEVSWDVEPNIEPFDHTNQFESNDADAICLDKSNNNELIRSSELALSASGSKMNFPRVSTKEPTIETSPPHKRTTLENKKRSSPSADEEGSSFVPPPPSSHAPDLAPPPATSPHPIAESSPRRRRHSDTSPANIPQVPSRKNTPPIPPPSIDVILPPPPIHTPKAISLNDHVPSVAITNSFIAQPLSPTTQRPTQPLVNIVCPIPISPSPLAINASTGTSPTKFPISSTNTRTKPTEISPSTPTPIQPPIQRHPPRRLQMEQLNKTENKEVSPRIPPTTDTITPVIQTDQTTQEPVSPHKSAQQIEPPSPDRPVESEPQPELPTEGKSSPLPKQPTLAFTPKNPELASELVHEKEAENELPMNIEPRSEPEQVKSDLESENEWADIEWEASSTSDLPDETANAVAEPVDKTSPMQGPIQRMTAAEDTKEVKFPENQIVDTVMDTEEKAGSIEDNIASPQLSTSCSSQSPQPPAAVISQSSSSPLPSPTLVSSPLQQSSPQSQDPKALLEPLIQSSPPQSAPPSPSNQSPSVQSPSVQSPVQSSIESPSTQSPSIQSPSILSPSIQSSPTPSPSIQSPSVQSSPVIPSPQSPTTLPFIDPPPTPSLSPSRDPLLQAVSPVPKQPEISRRQKRQLEQSSILENREYENKTSPPTKQGISSPEYENKTSPSPIKQRASSPIPPHHSQRVSYHDLLQQPNSPTYPQKQQKQPKRKRRKAAPNEEIAQPEVVAENTVTENPTTLLPQHPIISSMLMGISQSVELEPPLSPSLLPEDPMESEWEIDKSQFPGEPLYNYMIRRLAIVFSPPSTGLSIASLNSCEDLFFNPNAVINHNTDMVASAFLKVLHDCTSPSKADVAVQLFWQIFQATAKGNEFRNFCFRRITGTILTAQSAASVAYLCQLFARICKSGGDLDQVLYFSYEILKQAPVWKTQLLYMLAQWWPDPFIAKELKIGQPLLNAIEHLISFTSGDPANPECSKEVAAYESLRKACYWPFRENPRAANIDALVPQLIDVLVNSVEDPDSDPRSLLPYRTNIVFKALELIGVYKGYLWTYNNLIVSQLWPLMAPTPANCKKVKLIPASVRLVGILGRTAELEALQELRTKMTLILSTHFIEKHKLSFLAQTCVALTLVDLAKGDKNITAPCKVWYESLPLDKRHEISHFTGLIECVKK